MRFAVLFRGWVGRWSPVLLILALACGEDEPSSVERVVRTRPKRSPVAADKGPGGGGTNPKGPGQEVKLTLPKIEETDFIESDHRRDPFQPFADTIAKRQQISRSVQREIKLNQYDISELKLIAIITNIGNPRAMVVTPEGTGYVISRGDYLGRADYVEPPSGSGEPIQLNWRVARIHGSGKEAERGVYLVRTDPTRAERAEVTRFVPLHPRK